MVATIARWSAKSTALAFTSACLPRAIYGHSRHADGTVEDPAPHLVARHVSARGEQVGVSLKSTWFLMHRIREAMRELSSSEPIPAGQLVFDFLFEP
jgi:hypothetical protein